jgi:hypothetical protein
MITEYMRIDTTSDADYWAGDILEGYDESDYDIGQAVELLSEWLWKNKPSIGCTWAEHPISSISHYRLWDIVEKAEKTLVNPFCRRYQC